jgi:hypothetical protein
MTGWKTDEKTMSLVDTMRSMIAANPDLMPSAWYWLSLHVERVLEIVDEEKPRNMYDDADYLEFIKSDPDRLASRIVITRRVQRAYESRLAEINDELTALCGNQE